MDIFDVSQAEQFTIGVDVHHDVHVTKKTVIFELYKNIQSTIYSRISQ